jgi:cell division protein FtsI/penicillin-binding protein 2
MFAVVTQGTGTAVEIPGVPVAAKTGTADRERPPHRARPL